MYDLTIVGSGPAGMSAAIYAGRLGLKTLLLDMIYSGGQMTNTFEVENYPGIEEVLSGAELAFKFETQVKKFGAEIKSEPVTGFDFSENVKKVMTSKNSYLSKTVIIATGATPKTLDVDGETKLKGRGVSYCATCDGAFFRQKDVAVVGGGDTALEDAVFLSRFCTNVYLIHRRDSFRGSKILQNRVFEIPNIHIMYNSTLTQINGTDSVENIKIQNISDNTFKEIDLSGVFIAVGTSPSNSVFKDILDLSDDGYIITNENMSTNTAGVFAAGDIRKKRLRQIVTAASDGAIAAYSASIFVEENK